MEDCEGCRISTPVACPFVRGVRGAGYRLFRAGSPAEALYRVSSGEVLLHRGTQALALRGAGALVGLEALGGGSYRNDATCHSMTVVCVLAASRLPSFAAGSAASALELAREAAAEVDRWAAEHAAAGDCTARLAAFLLDRAEGAPHVPRSTIAALLHMRPETLSRCVHRLAEAGAIDAGTLAVRGRALLERLAEGGER